MKLSRRQFFKWLGLGMLAPALTMLPDGLFGKTRAVEPVEEEPIVRLEDQIYDRRLYVSDNGSDLNDGLTIRTPLKTLLAALNKGQPDTTDIILFI
jgi:hypothetical protein